MQGEKNSGLRRIVSTSKRAKYTHAANYLVNCKVIQTSGGAWNPWKKGKERNKKSVVRKRPL